MFLSAPKGSIVVSGCESSTDGALDERGTIYSAMKCEDDVIILAPIKRTNQRHGVPNENSTHI